MRTVFLRRGFSSQGASGFRHTTPLILIGSVRLLGDPGARIVVCLSPRFLFELTFLVFIFLGRLAVSPSSRVTSLEATGANFGASERDNRARGRVVGALRGSRNL